MRPVDAAELLGAGMDVHEGHLRRRDIEQRVALARHLAEPAADEHDEIGRLDPREQLRVRPDAEIAGIAGMQRVNEMGAAEARRDRHRKLLGERRDRGAARLRPSAAAENEHRPLRLGDEIGELGHLRGAGRGLDRPRRRRVGDRDPLDQHVLGERDHHRAGTAAGRDMEGARHDLRHPRGIIDLGRPLGHGAEHGAVIELLERLALAHLARHLADEHDHRRGILLRDVDAGRGVGGARSAGDEADAGAPGHLADRFRHHRCAALVAAYGDGDVAVVKRIEHGEIAFARHAEGVPDAVDDQLIDQHLGSGAQIILGFHVTFPAGLDVEPSL